MAKLYGGRWEIVKSLRPGGQAETFVVRDIRAIAETTEFVLKRIRNPERHGRFKAEVAALQALNHSNIVRLIDADVDCKTPYLVMEYCRGGSMDDHPGRWSADPVRTLNAFAEICDGVGVAHASGIVHRDIKPANILLRSVDGSPVVADFGIVFVADGERQTLTDEAVGARRFTAPELADGRANEISPRTDIYSLGKVLFWMLNGGRVFDREQHRDPSWDLARQTESHPHMEHINRVLDNMIAHEPSKRYSSATVAAGVIRHVCDLVRRRVRVLATDLAQECSFCQQGEYATIRMEGAIDARNLGISPVSSSDWKALVCTHCGNLQLFRVDHTDKKRWWGERGSRSPVR